MGRVHYGLGQTAEETLSSTLSLEDCIYRELWDEYMGSAKERQMKTTAGTLLYRQRKKKLEVLLVHPSGNYNRKSRWSIPKGMLEKSETLEEAARRETLEETGVRPSKLEPLGHVDYGKSRKRLHCFFGVAPSNANPSTASWEVDRAEFVPFEKAKKEIHQDQAELLHRLGLILNVYREPA
jgi:predicted NUDIX family NTP pyrophosphohydrolase